MGTRTFDDDLIAIFVWTLLLVRRHVRRIVAPFSEKEKKNHGKESSYDKIPVNDAGITGNLGGLIYPGIASVWIFLFNIY